MKNLIVATLFATAAAAQAQLPVALTYTCPTQTGSLPNCTTTFVLPARATLIIQYVSGSATPINPNPTTGAFATGQASLSLTTQLTHENAPATPNIIGPNYAIGGSQIWFFTNPVTFYTDTLPIVQNNGGSVYLQGVLVGR